MTSPSDIAGLSERLRDDIHQLTKSMEATSFAGGETDVRVKGPSLLLTDLKDADAALDSLTARVKELEATLFAAQQAVLTEGMERIRAEQQRDDAYERAAKICDAEFDRIISKQTPTDDPLSMADTVNTNIRMMACILPEVAAAIRRLASGPEGGAT